MSVGSPRSSTATSAYTRLPKGTRLWHVYPDRFASLAFNPSSTNRFATPPPPDCAMFYAASSSSGALWEAVLRNLVIDGTQPQHVDPNVVAGRSIVELEVVQEIKILDLRSPHLRRLSSDRARCDEWQRLCIVPEADYPETHAEAKALRSTWTEASGLCWYSRQIGDQCAYVFYRPPHRPSAFREVRNLALDTTEGWALIDAALAIVGVKRLGASALAAEIEPDLPPP